VAAFFVLGVLLQVFLAGVGVFGINARKVTNASSFDPHRAWGSALMVVSIILLILALIAWQSLSTVLSTFVLALLVVGAQMGLAAAGDSNKWIGGAHALDGMVILLLALWLAIMAWRRRTRPAAAGDHGEKNLDHRA
jgi:heme A synthase